MPTITRRYALTFATPLTLVLALTAALALLKGRIIILDAVISYCALAILVAYVLGRAQAAVTVLFAPVGFLVLVLAGIVRTDIALWETYARAAGLAAVTLTALYAMPRWLTGAEEYRTASQHLSEQKALLQAIVGSSPVAIISVDRDLIVREWNPAAERMLGWPAQDMIGRPLTALAGTSEQRDVVLRQRLSRVVQEGHQIIAHEAELIHNNASRRRVRISMGPLKEDGKIVGAAGTIEDITDARLLEEHVLRSQRIESLGRLAGGVAHDFSNLMTVIIGHVELDLMSRPSEDQLRRDLEEIHETAMRAANLAQQLLAFSRRQMIEPRVLELDELVRGTERMLRRVIGEHIDLKISSRLEGGRVRVDQGQLELVLVNLALNARDAMPDGGTLAIETSATTGDPMNGGHEESPYLVIAVSDTGCGMTDEVKQHLFEPFFTTKEVGRGTGLGLATCYGIIKQAGGQIWVESEPERGTVVRIYLPAVPDTAAETDDRDPAHAPPRGTETILLVEDEPLLRRLASRVLGDLGYTVIEAANGEEALRMVRSGADFQLLLTDVVMPGLGGQRVADETRALRGDARVLFMSGYTDDAVVRRGLSERSIDFLQKPFTPTVLATKVRQVLDAPSRRPGAGITLPR